MRLGSTVIKTGITVHNSVVFDAKHFNLFFCSTLLSWLMHCSTATQRR